MGAHQLLLLFFDSHLKGAVLQTALALPRQPESHLFPTANPDQALPEDAEGCAVLGHLEGSAGPWGRQRCRQQGRKRKSFDSEVEGESPETLPSNVAAGL